MSEKSNSDQNKKSGSPSKSNPLADALERLERSVAQREGSRMTSLVKPIKEGANESNGELSKTPSTTEEIIKEPSNSINREEINSNKTGYSAKLSFFIFSSFIVTALFIILGMVFWPYAKKLLNSELTAIHETAISDKEPLNEGILNKLGDVNLRLDVLSKNLDQISSLSNSSAADVYEELDYLRQRNELISLGDLAIHNADRQSLDKLISIREKNADLRLQSGAASEILRVKLAYMNGLRRGSQSIPIGQLFPEYDVDNEVDLNTEQLISLLDDLEAVDAHRVRAAYLLADKRNVKAATALVNVVANDSNLDVVREAAMTFSEMTGFRNEDLLDANSLVNWWEKNSDKVLPDLKN